MSLVQTVSFAFIAICTIFSTTTTITTADASAITDDHRRPGAQKRLTQNREYENDDFIFAHEDSIDLTQGNFIGRVNIGASFILSFDLQVTQQHGNYWANILHIGNENQQRSPGIWLYPSSTQLHIRLSDAVSWNSGTDPSNTLSLNTKYNIRLDVPGDGSVLAYLDDSLVASSTGVAHVTRWLAPVFASDPYYSPVIGTISNLIIEPYTSEGDSGTDFNETDYLVGNDHEQDSFIVNYLDVGQNNDEIEPIGVISNKQLQKTGSKIVKSVNSGENNSINSSAGGSGSGSGNKYRSFNDLDTIWKVLIIFVSLIFVITILCGINNCVVRKVLSKQINEANEYTEYSGLLA